MRYLFLILYIFLNFEVANANFLNKKPESLLFIEDEEIRNQNPLVLYFDINQNSNQLSRNSFKIHDTYLFANMFGALKSCNNRWGGLPSRNDIAKIVKEISMEEFKVFNSGYLGKKFRGPIQCAPAGKNKEVFLAFVDEYIKALKLIVADKEKYLATINTKESKINENIINTLSDNSSDISGINVQEGLRKNKPKNENNENQVAKEEVLNIERLENESKSRIADIKEFSIGNKTINAIELAQLFLKFNKSVSTPWTNQTVKNYIELLDYMKSIDGWNKFILNKDIKKQKETEEEVDIIISDLKIYEKLLKNYVAENLGEIKSNEAIKFLEKINSLYEKKDLNELLKVKNKIRLWLLDKKILK